MPVLSSISVEKDEQGFMRSETFRTERGFELSIHTTPSGLYEIRANSGGKAPTVCNGLYTSHLKARKALIEYIESTDRLGFAEHPDKKPEQVRKPRNVASQE